MKTKTDALLARTININQSFIFKYKKYKKATDSLAQNEDEQLMEASHFVLNSNYSDDGAKGLDIQQLLLVGRGGRGLGLFNCKPNYKTYPTSEYAERHSLSLRGLVPTARN